MEKLAEMSFIDELTDEVLDFQGFLARAEAYGLFNPDNPTDLLFIFSVCNEGEF